MSKRALSTGGNVKGSLKWDVFVASGIPTAASDLPPGTQQGMWSPISSTLIYGKRDAVLVDAFITAEQADALVWNCNAYAKSALPRSASRTA